MVCVGGGITINRLVGASAWFAAIFTVRLADLEFVETRLHLSASPSVQNRRLRSACNAALSACTLSVCHAWMTRIGRASGTQQ